jgi:DNA-binding NarL/FixJ family response regulator
MEIENLNRIVCFRENYKEYFKKVGAKKKDFTVPGFDFTWCETFNDLSKALGKETTVILFAPEMIKKNGSMAEFMLMLRTMIQFSNNPMPILAVSIYNTTTIQEVRELQKYGFNGIIPSRRDFTQEDRAIAFKELIEKRQYWPKHILDSLEGQKSNNKIKDIQLTSRQKEVFDLIATRGLSNKQIAQVLKISESTVKIHVSAIMKTMCVRNRTQLVLMAK